MRYAQLDGQTVINVIELEEHLDEWDGYKVVPSDEAGPGDIYDGKVFTRPTVVEPEPTPPAPEERIAQLEAQIAMLAEKAGVSTEQLEAASQVEKAR